MLIHYCCVIVKGGMALRPGRRVEISYLKGVMFMHVCDILLFAIKALPDMLKLAILIAVTVKSKRRPHHKG